MLFFCTRLLFLLNQASELNYMYYSLADLNNFDKLDFVIQIKRKTGKQTAIV